MTQFTQIPERALVLAGQVGENLKNLAPSGAGKWIDAGMKLGAVKAGTRVARQVVMRNPAAVVAVAAGAGALWYLARRRAKQAENGSADGNSTRVEAKRGNGSSRTTARKRARKTTTTS